MRKSAAHVSVAWLATLLLTVTIGAAGCSGPSAESPNLRAADPTKGFGIAADFIGQAPEDIDGALADYRSIGATWARVQILWYRVQPVAGGPYNWDEYDLLIGKLRASGIRPVGLLSSTPAWARSQECLEAKGWETACPPNDVEAFAKFAAAAAHRYSDAGVVWEVWNEPNLKPFWQPAPDPTAYTRLLIATHDAIKRVDPDATVISGGLTAALNPSQAIDPVEFLQKMYANGAKDHFDGVGWHPYLAHKLDEDPRLPGDPATWGAWSAMYDGPVNARSVMQSNGDETKKIWVTEFGNHTDVDSELGATEEQQAAIDRRAIELWQTFDWAAAFCFYTYRDSRAYGAFDNPEAYFGLWRVDGTPKPAAEVLRSMTRTGNG